MFKNILTQTTKKFSYFLITVILVLGLSIAVQSLLAAWTTPTASPPSGNISPPLTEGANDQVKIGSLGIASNFYVFDDVILATSSGAKVGIGTAFPAHKLHVYEKDPSGNGNAEIDIQSGGEPNDNSHWAIYHSNSDNSLRFWRNDNRLTILPDGNIGIGTTTPKAKLEVNGTIKASAPVENDDLATKSYVDAAGGWGWLECWVNCWNAGPDCTVGAISGDTITVGCYDCNTAILQSSFYPFYYRRIYGNGITCDYASNTITCYGQHDLIMGSASCNLGNSKCAIQCRK